MTPVARSDAPAALVMGLGFLAFGLTMILRPANVRANFDRFAKSWKEYSWHPYKMPFWGLRLAGVVMMGVATLFFYIAYIGLSR
jgi:hypothetical protein